VNYFNYFSEIEETFVRRRGKHLLLSPIDWALIETWQERGVPLHVVLRGIEKVFDSREQKAKQTRTVKSLFYCKEEIEAQYAEWLERQVGKNGAAETENDSRDAHFSEDSIAAHLETVGAQLKIAEERARGDLREVLQRVSQRLDELKGNFSDAETLESALEDLEKLIDRHFLKTRGNKEIEAEIERSLAAYKNKMETEVYRRTYDLMLLKRLRERAEIPRLSLFYL
jgi:predicted RNase H-like HicB family nuclease